MKKFRKVETERCEEIQCDKCGHVAKRESDIWEFNEFLSITRQCGYGAGQDDGRIFELDLCQSCSRELLGQYWRNVNPV